MMLASVAFAALTAGLVFASEAAAQCPDGTPPPCASVRGRTPAPTSVAVLYFDNLSRDTADLYLIDGIAEELTGKLGTVTRLRLPGPSVVRRAQQAANGDAIALGRALNVRYLVEGSLRRSGQRVRVSSRLLRASDGVLVWSDNYDRTMSDLLALQEDIAGQVAAAVTGQLLPGERSTLAARPTTNAAAYDHYLRGRYLIVRRTLAAMTQAAAEFEEAARLDPRFAAAEAGRATSFILAYGYGVPLAPDESLGVRARRSAERALQLDSLSADAWSAMGQVQLWFTPFDLDASRAMFERAIQLDPRSPDPHHLLGLALQTQGDLDSAAAAFRRALVLDPGRAVSLLDIAEIRAVQGRFDESRAIIDSAIALEPLQARLYWLRSALRRRAGDVAGGRADAERALELSGPWRIRMGSLVQLMAFDRLAHDSATARMRLAEVARMPVGAWPAMTALALVHLGMNDSALAVLRRGPNIPVDFRMLPQPIFDALRALPGYHDAVAPWRPRRPRT